MDYFTIDLDWQLKYGALPAGDYRIRQSIDSATDSAVFYAPFHIYREELPSEQEAALARCDAALTALADGQDYAVLLSETAPDGNVYPTKQITKSYNSARVDHYVGEFCVSSNSSEEAIQYIAGWEDVFRPSGNRQFLFPDGKSVISQEEITFCSVWADYKGTAYRGTDTFRFSADGTLESVDKLVQTLDGSGSVVDEQVHRVSRTGMDWGYISDLENYAVKDSFDAQEDSPWKIFFRVDDDLLSPGAGEIWLAVDTIGVSNYTTDGNYWLEKKQGTAWERLGGEGREASWGDGTIKLTNKTTIVQVDWSSVYGELDAGVYRMGKRFCDGTESIIQYAEFAIYPVGDIFGEGAEEALARVDAAIAALQAGNYRVEKYISSYSPYGNVEWMSQVIWKYGETMVTDYYNDAEEYSHSIADHPGDTFYGDWLERTTFPSEYDSIYFPVGYSKISDEEIQFLFSFGQNSLYNPCQMFTYRFDGAGNLTEILLQYLDSDMWSNSVTRYVVTNTPDSEIAAWVQEQDQ